MPRFILLLHSNADAEAGKMPSEDEFLQMQAFNNELKKAGMLLSAEGLHASSKGARVDFPPTDNSNPGKPGPKSDIRVTPGPFPIEGEHKLVCGLWIIKAEDLDEAVTWVKKAPITTSVEVRQIHELDDLKGVMPESMREEAQQFKDEQEGKRK